MKHDSGLDGALNIITQLIKLSKMTLCMCNSQKKHQAGIHYRVYTP